ncbi:MAG: hypothetical protein HF978_06565 [Desulfobacteraceae bacterium]|nr:hypothetical protein [Desulfobacteraceae bacterium]MBC2755194.1 hypothetical protein [Desulfobacteraceae bacterium]
MPKLCGFDNTVDCLVGRSSCPAEKAIHLCNAIQVYLMGENYEFIRDNFELKLMQELSKLGYECFVFWTPEGEKAAGRTAIIELIQDSEWYNRSVNHKRLNDVILALNDKFHSHDFLRKLVDVSTSAKSRVFRMCVDDKSILFSSFYPDINKSNIDVSGTCEDIKVKIPFSTAGSPKVFLNSFLKDGDFEDEQTTKALREYIESYTDKDKQIPDIIKAVNKVREADNQLGPNDVEHLIRLWKGAIKHIALIFLFSELNSFTSVTYYLSPLDRDKLKSSMVIYWKDREPGRSFHYLIQMLLGLNAAPILLHQEEINQRIEAQKIALGHYGHTLKHRIDTLNSFLDEHGTPAIRLRKDMLRDLTLILQLNTVDNREELLEHLPARKRDRFLDIEGTDGVEENLDLIQEIKEWYQLISGQRKFNILDENRGINEERVCDFELRVISEVDQALIGLHMEVLTKKGKRRVRLKKAIYRELIFELLNNTRYGAYQVKYTPEKVGNYLVFVRVMLSQAQVFINGSPTDLLVMSNEIQPAKADDVFIASARNSQGWLRWPESKKYDGPGMSVELFRRLKLGDMYYLVEEIQGHIIYRVGLFFEGMNMG